MHTLTLNTLALKGDTLSTLNTLNQEALNTLTLNDNVNLQDTLTLSTLKTLTLTLNDTLMLSTLQTLAQTLNTVDIGTLTLTLATLKTLNPTLSHTLSTLTLGNIDETPKFTLTL